MLRRLSLVAIAVTALAACQDNSALTASLLVEPDTLVAYALSDTVAAYPSGLNTVARTVVHVDGSGNFDVAFDIDQAGNVVVLPVRLIVNPLTGVAPSVGLQALPLVPYDSLTLAPTGYYRPDTAMTVAVGQTFAILANRNGGATLCYALATPQVYSKVVIDSVNLTNKSIHFRHVVDPNCGYRSFVFGLPTK